MKYLLLLSLAVVAESCTDCNDFPGPARDEIFFTTFDSANGSPSLNGWTYVYITDTSYFYKDAPVKGQTWSVLIPGAWGTSWHIEMSVTGLRSGIYELSTFARATSQGAASLPGSIEMFVGSDHANGKMEFVSDDTTWHWVILVDTLELESTDTLNLWLNGANGQFPYNILYNNILLSRVNW